MPIPLINFTSFQLTNGLRVFLAPTAKETGAAVHLAIDAGSGRESPGSAGMAHVLHSALLQNMSPPAKKGKTGNAADELQIDGAINLERATFYADVTAGRLLESVIARIAGRLQVPEILQSGLDEAMHTFREACRQFNEQPLIRVQEALLQLIFGEHAHRHAPICSRTDLSQLTPGKARSFFNAAYTPDRMVLVVVGNFRERVAAKFIEHHFSALKISDTSDQTERTDEAVPDAPGFPRELSKIIHDPQLKAPYYLSAFPTVPSNHPDWYALNILADILGQGESSRLVQALVAPKFAAAVPEAMTESRSASLLYLGVDLVSGVPVAQVERILDSELTRLRNAGVTDLEIETARSQERAWSAEQLRTPGGMANFLARAALYYNHPNRINEELDRILAVSAKEVQRAAKRYLRKDNRAVVIALPEVENDPRIGHELA